MRIYCILYLRAAKALVRPRESAASPEPLVFDIVTGTNNLCTPLNTVVVTIHLNILQQFNGFLFTLFVHWPILSNLVSQANSRLT